jgi:hypothetical protein
VPVGATPESQYCVAFLFHAENATLTSANEEQVSNIRWQQLVVGSTVAGSDGAEVSEEQPLNIAK